MLPEMPALDLFLCSCFLPGDNEVGWQHKSTHLLHRDHHTQQRMLDLYNPCERNTISEVVHHKKSMLETCDSLPDCSDALLTQ